MSSVSASTDEKLAFRNAVGAFPTGVCVVTSSVDGEQAGMTLNSFASVSLEPLLVLASLAHGSRTLRTLRASGHFAISVLGRGQQEVALAFAARSAVFPQHLVRRTDYGFFPVRGALAELYCDVHDVVTAGDHDLVLGRVREFGAADGEPLVFHRGRFGGVAADRPAPSAFLDWLEEGSGW